MEIRSQGRECVAASRVRGHEPQHRDFARLHGDADRLLVLAPGAGSAHRPIRGRDRNHRVAGMSQITIASLQGRIETVRESVEFAADHVGRSASDVTIVAVSKTVDRATMQAAYDP